MQSKLVIVIGRGHSGTRAVAQTLLASGVYMGNRLNASNDLVPPEPMYEASRLFGGHVVYRGGQEWDFSQLRDMEIEQPFTKLLDDYLRPVHASNAAVKGWKLPETNLMYPWIVRLFPEAYFVHWVRDPRDAVIGEHITDDLSQWNVPCDKTQNVRLQRAISWKYQADIVEATPRPENFITVRFEDFVLDQQQTLGRLEAFLEMPLVRTTVNAEAVGRYKSDDGEYDFTFLHQTMTRFGYLPDKETDS